MTLKKKIEILEDAIKETKIDKDGRVNVYQLKGLFEILKDFMDIKTDDIDLKQSINEGCLVYITEAIKYLDNDTTTPIDRKLIYLTSVASTSVNRFVHACNNARFPIT